jgi:Ca2+-binding RTX toxin-like protein
MAMSGTLRRCAALGLAAAVGSLTAAGPVQASTAAVGGTTVNYVAAGGEVNNVNIVVRGELSAGSQAVITDVVPITPGFGCTALSANQVRCVSNPGWQNFSLRVDLGDRNDTGRVQDDRDAPDRVQFLDGPGNDRVNAVRGGPTSLINGPGNDSLIGGDYGVTSGRGFGNDVIVGGLSRDYISAGPGFDHVYGNAGNDVLYGDAGNDRIYGGRGLDLLYGGLGLDLLDGAYRDFRRG